MTRRQPDGAADDAVAHLPPEAGAGGAAVGAVVGSGVLSGVAAGVAAGVAGVGVAAAVGFGVGVAALVGAAVADGVGDGDSALRCWPGGSEARGGRPPSLASASAPRGTTMVEAE